MTANVSSAYPKDTESPRGGVEDMTRLAYLHEPGVLQNLKSRYGLNEIYVSCVFQHIIIPKAYFEQQMHGIMFRFCQLLFPLGEQMPFSCFLHCFTLLCSFFPFQGLPVRPYLIHPLIKYYATCGS